MMPTAAGIQTPMHMDGLGGPRLQTADAAHIDSRLHAHGPGHALARDQGQPHTMLGTRGYTRVTAGRACKWEKGIPPQKVV